MNTKLPAMMRSWQFTTNTGPFEKRLRLNNVPIPTPKPAEHLVKVVAMSVNPVDYKPAENSIACRLAIPKPATPGFDFSGYIVTPAKGSSLEPGQAVFGVVGASALVGGALQEYATARVETVAAVPHGVSMTDAATIGVAGETGYGTLVPRLKAGESVFINGGSGGVGVFSVQIAKAIGCHVTTTCSSRNVDFVKSIGADDVVDYSKVSVVEALKKSGRKFDLIVDNVSSDSNLYYQCHHYAAPKAEYLHVGGRPELSYVAMMMAIRLRPSWLGGGRRKCGGFFAVPKTDELERIGNWMKEGKVKAIIDSQFSFEEAPNAYVRSKTGRARGKIVINVSEPNEADKQ